MQYLTQLCLLVVAILFHGCDKQTRIQPNVNDYPIEPVPFTQVKVNDDFWQPRMETNRVVTVPYTFQKSEETGRISNFAKAGGQDQY